MLSLGKPRRVLIASILLAGLIILIVPIVALLRSGSMYSRNRAISMRFYVPEPNHGAIRQIAELTASGNEVEADLIRAMIGVPTAVWIVEASPARALQQVRQVMQQAAAKGTVPILVLYTVPFRDCAQYSAGGATSVAEYTAWIDNVAAGIGDHAALVILEPDSLGIIPWYTTITGVAEWCQPAAADPTTAATERFRMLNYAVDALKALPHTTVYLDGTHSAWLSVSDIADRLIKAGVMRADGFFLNVSNYQLTARQLKYGAWIAQCIYLDQHRAWPRDQCADQYNPANPNDFSTWDASDAAYAQAFAGAGLPRNWSAMPRFVIDTSRNGQGPWTALAGAYADPQAWCNPPDRGLGIRPTTNTDHPLADAYLWIKTPGESDGQCVRGTAGPADPARGVIAPAAGHWFADRIWRWSWCATPIRRSASYRASSLARRRANPMTHDLL